MKTPPGPLARAYLSALDRFSELVDGRLERARLGIFENDTEGLEHQKEILFRRAEEYEGAVRAGVEVRCPELLTVTDSSKDQWRAALAEANQLRAEAMA